MLRLTFFAFFLFSSFFSFSQQSSTPGEVLERPKLVVGLVVDQMRWDFLYRYYDRYLPQGGFRRMLNQGFSCENTFIPYSPTVTAPGHTTIYTGTVPAIHGIAGNAWWDHQLRRNVYCTEDKTVGTVGSSSSLGMQSPRNLLVTTIGDELKLADPKSKVIGIAIKDRGGILTAGHSADAAYWYDNSNGHWITSTYYMSELPGWVKKFNEKKLADKYYEQGWKTLYPINTYDQSTADDKPYELKAVGTGFPYDLSRFKGKNYGAVASTPHGNSFTLALAREAIDEEKLGDDRHTDMLAISFSSPDYIGHSYGPNSIEQEDNFLRLDKELGEFLDYLDNKVGKGKYLIFLSADHGAAHVPGFLLEKHIPAGHVDGLGMDDALNSHLQSVFGVNGLVKSTYNYQVSLDDSLMSAHKLDRKKVVDEVSRELVKHPGIVRAFPSAEIMTQPIPMQLREMLSNGYFPQRGGEVQVLLRPHWIEGFLNGGTTHGSWNPYDTHIPLLWYGWGIKPGKMNRETYMTDIAPTLAAMLRIQMPSGSTGKAISEVLK